MRRPVASGKLGELAESSDWPDEIVTFFDVVSCGLVAWLEGALLFFVFFYECPMVFYVHLIEIVNLDLAILL